ncbi:porin family protein [Enterovibrio sp. ZSDZ42]|uniref:Porin family protein n=1 Tax=Enterovibrio gelatinilyticus TaxID=2899819 RepID=A0ABT5R884_9GAMM|nr:outer membrane beta-barrel protein [Enterovibrio sp. ZSDZ42]MDD1796045.1 porin family protein [Enterovibrio sp. ZSDZ42]
MNKTPSILTLALLAALSAPSALADVYAGALLGYSNTEYVTSTQAGVSEASPLLLQAQVGYFFNDYVALEARYGTSLQRTDGVSINSLASAYVKGNIPVSDQIAMYALVGVSATDIDYNASHSTSHSGISFGLGTHYALSRDTALTFEFVNAQSGENTNLNAVNLGFQYRF